MLQIDYRLPESGGLLTISVFDTRGRLLHNICKKELSMVDRGTLYWNGEAEGRKAQTGMYIFYLEYQYHNKITKAKKTAVLAR